MSGLIRRFSGGLALLFIIVAAVFSGLMLLLTIASVVRKRNADHLRPWIALLALFDYFSDALFCFHARTADDSVTYTTSLLFLILPVAVNLFALTWTIVRQARNDSFKRYLVTHQARMCSIVLR